jgi:hypothetical protein
LVNSEYPGQHLSIEDACAQTHRRMRVDVFDGEIVATDPRSLYLLRGGT